MQEGNIIEAGTIAGRSDDLINQFCFHACIITVVSASPKFDLDVVRIEWSSIASKGTMLCSENPIFVNQRASTQAATREYSHIKWKLVRNRGPASHNSRYKLIPSGNCGLWCDARESRYRRWGRYWGVCANRAGMSPNITIFPCWIRTGAIRNIAVHMSIISVISTIVGPSHNICSSVRLHPIATCLASNGSTHSSIVDSDGAH